MVLTEFLVKLMFICTSAVEKVIFHNACFTLVTYNFGQKRFNGDQMKWSVALFLFICFCNRFGKFISLLYIII